MGGVEGVVAGICLVRRHDVASGLNAARSLGSSRTYPRGDSDGLHLFKRREKLGHLWPQLSQGLGHVRRLVDLPVQDGGVHMHAFCEPSKKRDKDHPTDA